MTLKCEVSFTSEQLHDRLAIMSGGSCVALGAPCTVSYVASSLDEIGHGILDRWNVPAAKVDRT